ncbi:hypothetical protein LEP1GSC086_0780 [Leptospira weilii str. LNT 1234]|nr:hypothetical protein LEP1GSC086_0780 [Leptospira weilii str. LNT 1234]
MFRDFLIKSLYSVLLIFPMEFRKKRSQTKKVALRSLKIT